MADGYAARNRQAKCLLYRHWPKHDQYHHHDGQAYADSVPMLTISRSMRESILACGNGGYTNFPPSRR